MQNVNAIAKLFFDIVRADDGGTTAFVKPFCKINAVKEKNATTGKDEYFLESFVILVRMCFMDVMPNASDDEKRMNAFASQSCVSWKLELKKVDDANLPSEDITNLREINLAEIGAATSAFGYRTYSHIFKTSRLKLEHGPGQYAIQILLKEKTITSDNFVIQSMSTLQINEPLR